MDRQVNHRIHRLIWVAINFWGGEGWVSACHHCRCRVVPDDEDAQSLAKVTHHLVLVLAKVLCVDLKVLAVIYDLKFLTQKLFEFYDIFNSSCPGGAGGGQIYPTQLCI